MKSVEDAEAILIGGKWTLVRNGVTCQDEIKYQTAQNVYIVVKRSAIDAYRLVERPSRPAIQRNCPWEQS